MHAVCAGYGTPGEAEAVDGSYHCLLCATRRGARMPRRSGATLLICPQAILGQWRGEAGLGPCGERVAQLLTARDALRTSPFLTRCFTMEKNQCVFC